MFQKLTKLEIVFLLDNEVFSNKGILRGLYFQKGKFANAKLVSLVRGKVLDVVVDLRTESKSFGKHFSIILLGEIKKQFLFQEVLQTYILL
jgi:dTDP-4-dehydrorhamnose 3,5-epimerase